MDNSSPRKQRNGTGSHNAGSRSLARYVVVVVGAGIVATFSLQSLSFKSMVPSPPEFDDYTLHQFGSKRQLGTNNESVNKDAFADIAPQVRKQIKMDREFSKPEKTFLFLNDEVQDKFQIPLKKSAGAAGAGRKASGAGRKASSAGGARAAVAEEGAEAEAHGEGDDDDEEEEENKDQSDQQQSSPETPPDFSNAPPPRNLTQDDYFGACLLIKDDNHWLIEWLAYHYHVMPLRRLIVAIDPDSKTSPKAILARWNYRMKITTMKDNEILAGVPIPKTMKKAYKGNTQLMYHRHRQNTFFIKCLRQLKKENVPWVHLTDTDEFIAINYASGQLYNLTKHHPIQQPGNVLSFLNHHQDVTHSNPQCIFMPRYMFGNKESSKALVARNVPKQSNILKGINFLTQRFMYRHLGKMQNGKNLVHLGAMPGKIQAMANVHRVSATCPSGKSVEGINHIKHTLVKVHHYLGTKEQYFFRSDPRKIEKKKEQITKGTGVFYLRDSRRYDELNRDALYSDSGARGWIRGFVKDVGLPMAEYLLAGVGQVAVK